MFGHECSTRTLWLWACVVVLTACGSPAEPNRENNGGVLPPPAVPGGIQGGSGGAPSVSGTSGTGALPGAGSGGVITAGSGAPPTTTVTGNVPCDAATVVATRCQTCHGATLIGGAPMHLVTLADFQADLTVKTTQGLIGQTIKAYTLAQQRIKATTLPMPPGGTGLPAAELTTLDAWLGAGAPAGTAADATCPGAVVPTDPVVPGPTTDPNETCYELPMHGGQTAGDTSPFTIKSGERYHCFYYDVPWTEPVVATRFTNNFQNTALIHHWLLYTTNMAVPGKTEECLGSHIGDNSQLLSGWAVGGNDMVMPADTGLELPAPGSHVLVEWHLYNNGGVDTPDNSAPRICTVPKGARPKTGSMTSLGTEDFGFGIPTGTMSEFGSTCTPSRAGMNATDPVHIFAFLPHMHNLGRHMKSVVNRAGGMQEVVFDKPFDFNQQISHAVSIDLMPGDTITSTCTFMNGTPAPVSFGSSTTQEMCYQFALSSPAGALKNGAFGLNGSTTNCW